ncbi:hypothetical protein E4U10_002651, partial [Claviceps purpurea]
MPALQTAAAMSRRAVNEPPLRRLTTMAINVSTTKPLLAGSIMAKRPNTHYIASLSSGPPHQRQNASVAQVRRFT